MLNESIKNLLTLGLLTLFVYHSKADTNEPSRQCDPKLIDSCKLILNDDIIFKDSITGGYNSSSSVYFRAAIYEHDRIDQTSARASVEANLDAYDKAAKIASTNGAEIIVFPEDGLYDMPVSWAADALEEIPDPSVANKTHHNPCNEPEKYANMEILLRLSCMAKSNRMYIVANYGTREKCTPGSKVKTQVCPKKAEFDMNTNVILGPDGTFLKRYRKWNLFIEAFDRATDIETVYIDTPLGRFGLFTCFDMLFKRPAMDLIEKHQIDTLLFPTWWYDELPVLTALGVQDGWSLANNVNLIAANIHKLDLGSVGSGLYSTNGDFIHTSSLEPGPKLLIANLPKKPRNLPYKKKSDIPFNSHAIDMVANNPPRPYKHLNFKLRSSDQIESLNGRSGQKTICNNEICCTLVYEISEKSYKEDKINRLKLVARDSLRISTFKWYEQQCFLAEMETDQINLNDPKKNIFSQKGSFEFHKITMNATFNTHHVFPIGLHNVNQLIQRTDREYSCEDAKPKYPDNPMYECKHSFKSSNKPAEIVSFGMYGRLYDRDQINYDSSVTKRWPDDAK